MEHTADKLSQIIDKFNVVFVTSYLTKHLFYSFHFNRATIVNEYFFCLSVSAAECLVAEREGDATETRRNCKELTHTAHRTQQHERYVCLCVSSVC